METIVVLQGDRTGQELLAQALRVLQPDVIGVELGFRWCDLSYTNRLRTGNEIVHQAAEEIKTHRYGLKAATDTIGDLGSPNAILREGIGASVIVRAGRPLPGIAAYQGIRHPITVVRMAVGDAYGAVEHRTISEVAAKALIYDDLELEPSGSYAYRVERIERSVCRDVAEYAFRLAKRNGATVFGGPKWTVSPVYEGMLKEEMDAAAQRHPDVRYEPQLIDAAVYLLFQRAQKEELVIPALNRDGDILSDLVLPLFGSIAGAESAIIALDDQLQPQAILAEAPHGTAPALEGKNVANPLAMALASATLLEAMPGEAEQKAGQTIRACAIDLVADGVKTLDLGGESTTSGFVDALVDRVRSALA